MNPGQTHLIFFFFCVINCPVRDWLRYVFSISSEFNSEFFLTGQFTALFITFKSSILFYIAPTALQTIHIPQVDKGGGLVAVWYEVQKEYYSGKKNAYWFFTSMNKSVLYLSPTYEGKAHDKSICDEEQIKFDVPVVFWEDLGFMGLGNQKR